LVASAALLLGWLVAPSPVPLYDGVGMPDEAYRFVAPPAGTRSTPPPTEAQALISLDGGSSCCELEARSAEQGPQVAVYVPRGGFHANGAATDSGSLSVVATPLAAPTGPPPVAKGKFEGNLYRVTAAGPAGPATLTADGARATLQLRALNGNSPGPHIWYRANATAGWRDLPSAKIGFDVYESQFVGAGDYVLVRKGGGGGSTTTVLLGILAIPALLIVLLIGLRLRSGPPPDDDDDDDDDDAQGDDAQGDDAQGNGEKGDGAQGDGEKRI
jgi:hypothetical protein